MSHGKEGRIAGVNFLSMREWMIVRKWRLAFARGTDISSKRTVRKQGYTCVDIGSGQKKLGRSILLIVSIS